MTIRIEAKPGVPLDRIDPILAWAILQVAAAYDANHRETCTITSTTDGKHKENSLHYSGRAADFRTWNIDKPNRPALKAKIETMLGNGFQVILEPTHLHIEYDPD